MANQYGINMGQILSNAESIKGAKTTNKLNKIKLDQIERKEAERPQKELESKRRNALLTDLRGKAVSGDEDAMSQLLALDPKGGADFIDAIGKMDKRRLEATKKSIDEMGQMSAYVLQGKDQAEQARRYELVRNSLPEEMRSRLPVRYSADFMELSLSKATAMDKLLENPEAINMGDKGELWKGGRKVGEYSTGKAEERASRQKEAKIKANKSGGSLKSADESLMYRQAAELLGGMFDQSGNLTNLDPETRNKIQAIATEATNIFVNEGNVTRSEAVKRAAKAYGLNVTDVPQSSQNDPNNIRNFLLNQ